MLCVDNFNKGIAVKLSKRLSAIAPFQVMAILEKARALQAAGHDVIHLEVGEPDFATPQAIVDAGRAALAAGHTYYTAAQGLAELRQAIAAFYQSRFENTIGFGFIRQGIESGSAWAPAAYCCNRVPKACSCACSAFRTS